MKKIFIIALAFTFLFSLSLTGCIAVAEDAGNLETRQFDFDGFNSVDIDSSFEYEIVRADAYAISVTADSDLFKCIKVTQEGNTLKIGFGDFHWLVWVWGKTSLQARVAMPQLAKLSISGASDGEVAGFNSAEDLDIKVSGASSLELTDMATGDIDIKMSGNSEVDADINADGDAKLDLSGASRLEMRGSARNMRIEASGASHVDMDDFAVRDASIDFSGASQATIMLDGKLDAELSGASQLYYIGEPTIREFDITGASKLEKK
jgi:hypothetical protein